jgi:hypothetical protein
MRRMGVKGTLALAMLLALPGCGTAANDDGDPRNRTGGEGPATWRVVRETGRAAAFLARPGAAPDLVVWCGQGALTLRAHVFKGEDLAADLSLTTPGGRIGFANVRRQGAVRDGRPGLVEGVGAIDPGTATLALAAAGDTRVAWGGEAYAVTGADPGGVMAGFASLCAAPSAPR